MKPDLNPFLDACRAQKQVTLIGPMLDQAPQWPKTPLLFVDGGARWRSAMPDDFRLPTLSVGDGDSLGSSNLDILLETRKDCSDLEFALELLTDTDIEFVNLLGFLGGRRDHEWINFGVVAGYLRNRSQQTVQFDAAVSLFAPGTYQTTHHGTFSVVHFHKAKTSIQGAVDYPLNKPTHFDPASSFGLSNVANGEVTLASDQVMMCFWLSGDF